jgi:hypothetical protein
LVVLPTGVRSDEQFGTSAVIGSTFIPVTPSDRIWVAPIHSVPTGASDNRVYVVPEEVGRIQILPDGRVQIVTDDTIHDAPRG